MKEKQMRPELVHLYGPLSINSFGLFIIIAIVVFSALFLSDPKRMKLISTDQYFNCLSLAILSGFIGGRLLFVLTNWDIVKNWQYIFAFWLGGFSLLGAVIAILLVLPFYFRKNKIKIVPLLDLVALYAPLLQAISRLGCFFAGCCFGYPTSLPFGIINTECGIPEFSNKFLHPTQLYSSLLLFIIFLLLYFIFQHYVKKSGQLACIYLFLMSTERFVVDFWRADREFLSNDRWQLLSISQLIAIGIAIFAFITFGFITLRKKKHLSS